MTTKKRIGVFVKIDAKALDRADKFQAWLEQKGIEVVRKENRYSDDDHASLLSVFKAPENLFCVFVLGGDGTFLSAVRWVGDQDIPVIGVKFGEVGFLAEITDEYLFPVAEEVIAGRFKALSRMRLKAKVVRDDETAAVETVLNDIVINKGALARLAHIETYVDGHYLTTFRADGLIISTPTGSTAYTLAAGGPVVHPAVPGIIITPICPFTLTNRPLIVPDTVTITAAFAGKSSDLMVTFDGQAGMQVQENDQIVVEKGTHPIRTIMMPGLHYFDVLKAKLSWSGGRV